MNLRPILVLTAALGGALSLPAQEAPKLNFVSIFDGHDLKGWHAKDADQFWTVVDGVLTGQNNAKATGSMLTTDASYGDCVVEVEARWDNQMDSGVFVRTPAVQMQIGTSVSLHHDMTGSFYISKKGYPKENQAVDAPTLLKLGDWNTLRLEARGNQFTVWLNGREAAHYTSDQNGKPGPIMLQVHPKIHGKVEYRAVRVAQLP